MALSAGSSYTLDLLSKFSCRFPKTLPIQKGERQSHLHHRIRALGPALLTVLTTLPCFSDFQASEALLRAELECRLLFYGQGGTQEQEDSTEAREGGRRGFCQ